MTKHKKQLPASFNNSTCNLLIPSIDDCFGTSKKILFADSLSGSSTRATIWAFIHKPKCVTVSLWTLTRSLTPFRVLSMICTRSGSTLGLIDLLLQQAHIHPMDVISNCSPCWIFLWWYPVKRCSRSWILSHCNDYACRGCFIAAVGSGSSR